MNEQSITNVTLRLAIGAMICAILLAYTVQVTEKPIAENARIAVEKSVYAVFPDSEKYTEFAVDDNTLKVVNTETPKTADKVFATYNKDGKLSGITFKAKARGYADDIIIMYGYNPEKECITGYKVLSSKETAGFGDQIFSGLTQKSVDFMKGFSCLDVRLNSEKSGLMNKIKMTAFGQKTNAWEFDGIAGATITSHAMEKMLVGSTEKIIPILVNNLDVLKNGNK